MLVWNDIAKYIKDYNNGIKKLDDAVSDANNLQKEKLNHKTNQFKLHSLTDDYGLNDKVTIRPMKFKYDNDLKNMFHNKSTPGNSLKGNVELSSGTKEVIRMTNKWIPKIDHSYIDPQYYEHKLEGKTNKDLILNQLSKSKSKEFAKNYVTGLSKPKLPERNPPSFNKSALLNDPLSTQIRSQLGPKFEEIPGSGGLAFQHDAKPKELER